MYDAKPTVTFPAAGHRRTLHYLIILAAYGDSVYVEKMHKVVRYVKV